MKIRVYAEERWPWFEITENPGEGKEIEVSPGEHARLLEISKDIAWMQELIEKRLSPIEEEWKNSAET